MPTARTLLAKPPRDGDDASLYEPRCPAPSLHPRGNIFSQQHLNHAMTPFSLSLRISLPSSTWLDIDENSPTMLVQPSDLSSIFHP